MPDVERVSNITPTRPPPSRGRGSAGLPLFAVLIVAAAPVAPDPQLAAAFRAAFGKSGSAILKRQGEMKESVKYTPGGLINAPFGLVLISPGEVLDPAHVSAGKLAAIYLKRSPKGFTVVKRFIPATETGSFGEIVTWRAHRGFGQLPVVSVEGGGTWQGYTCLWATLLELAPDKPNELVTVPLYYDDEGAVDEGKKASTIDGKIVRTVPGKSFDVVYSGSRSFTERYVRRGNSYVLAGGGKTRMDTC